MTLLLMSLATPNFRYSLIRDGILKTQFLTTVSSASLRAGSVLCLYMVVDPGISRSFLPRGKMNRSLPTTAVPARFIST